MDTFHNSDSLPVAPLKIIAMDNCIELGRQVDYHISIIRNKHVDANDLLTNLSGYLCDSYLAGYHMDSTFIGERQAIIEESVRGTDLFIITDVVNCNPINGKSPDEHYQDLRRVIGACHGSANRINVIMPYLYQGRFNNRRNLESLDCAIALKDMIGMGISNLITFDAHEPRVQNAIPIQGIDNCPTSFQFIEAIINGNENLTFDKNSLLIVSPDVGGMSRVVFYSTMLEVDMGMFYIRKDYSKNIDGEHPVVAVEFLGGDINGKDVIIVDDIIDSGQTIINTAKELKKRGANKVIIVATYGLFTKGLANFDKAYDEGIFNRIYTTNLTYISDELETKVYYKAVDMSYQIADLIHTINQDNSFEHLIDHSKIIKNLLKKHS